MYVGVSRDQFWGLGAPSWAPALRAELRVWVLPSAPSGTIWVGKDL